MYRTRALHESCVKIETSAAPSFAFVRMVRVSDETSTPTRTDRAGSKASLPLGVRIALTVLVAFLAAATVAGVWLGSRLTSLAED